MDDDVVVRQETDLNSGTLPDEETLPINGSQDGSQNGSHESSQNLAMPQPMRPIHRILHTPEMPQAQSMNGVAISRDYGHTSMLMQLAYIAFRMNTFHSDFDASMVSAEDMNMFHEEFNTFASEMSRMTIESNARLIKTRSERDDLLDELYELREQMKQLKLQQREQELRRQQEQQLQQEQQRQQEHRNVPEATIPVPAAVAEAAGSKKSKSEKTIARKALTIKVPRGPVSTALPSTFGPSSSSSGMVPASPFKAGPSSSMIPLSPFMTTPSTPFVTTPSSPSDVMPRASFMAAPSSNGPETPKNFMMPSFSDTESPTRYIPVPSSSIMELSSTFGNLPGSSGLSPQKGASAGASSSSGTANTTSFIRGPPPMDPTKVYKSIYPLELSPLTPDRIGPSTISSDQRTLNSVIRRKFNSLSNILPPATAFIPEVPLTDTEIIVYFFQSLSRPEVALRLYSRRWSPQTITDALNKHRHIEGGYLRNTTSVRCTTSIKRGKDKYGRNWYEQKRDVFANANDWLATQLIRQTGEEREESTDFDISKLDRELKQHPADGVDGGIFTKCVKWCCDRKDTAKYTLKNVHELVQALKWGDDLDELNEIFANQNGQQMMAQGVDGASNTTGFDTDGANTAGLDIGSTDTMGLDIDGANTMGLENFNVEDFNIDDFTFEDMTNVNFEAGDANEYEGAGEDMVPAYMGKGKGRAT